MTGRERTLRAIHFEPTDRAPVVGGFVRHPPFLAEAAGTSVEAFWADPKTVAIRAFRNLRVDCIIGLILPSPDSAIGAQVNMHKRSRFDSPEAVIEEIEKLPSLEELRRTIDQQACYDTFIKTYREGQAAIGDDILWLPNRFNCLAQFQNEGRFGAENYYMALRELQTCDGKPPVIVGSVSSVTTMPFGTPADVRADVRRCQKLAAAKGGGWLLNFSSSLGPEVPLENIHAFFDEAVKGQP